MRINSIKHPEKKITMAISITPMNVERIPSAVKLCKCTVLQNDSRIRGWSVAKYTPKQYWLKKHIVLEIVVCFIVTRRKNTNRKTEAG